MTEESKKNSAKKKSTRRTKQKPTTPANKEPVHKDLEPKVEVESTPETKPAVPPKEEAPVVETPEPEKKAEPVDPRIGTVNEGVPVEYWQDRYDKALVVFQRQLKEQKIRIDQAAKMIENACRPE